MYHNNDNTFNGINNKINWTNIKKHCFDEIINIEAIIISQKIDDMTETKENEIYEIYR